MPPRDVPVQKNTPFQEQLRELYGLVQLPDFYVRNTYQPVILANPPEAALSVNITNVAGEVPYSTDVPVYDRSQEESLRAIYWSNITNFNFSSWNAGVYYNFVDSVGGGTVYFNRHLVHRLTITLRSSDDDLYNIHTETIRIGLRLGASDEAAEVWPLMLATSTLGQIDRHTAMAQLFFRTANEGGADRFLVRSLPGRNLSGTLSTAFLSIRVDAMTQLG